MSISDDVLIENFNTPVGVDDLEVGKVYQVRSRYRENDTFLARLHRGPNSGWAGWKLPDGSPLEGGAYSLYTRYYNYFKEDPVTTIKFREGDTVLLKHKTIPGYSILGKVQRAFALEDQSIKLEQKGSLYYNAYFVDEFEIDLMESSPMAQFRELPIGGKFRMNPGGSVFMKVSETDAVGTAHYFEPTEEHFSTFEKVD